MKLKNNYQEQIALIQNDNINVSSTNDAKDFVVLVSALIGILLIIIFSFDFIAGLVIDNISAETQLKIESLFSNSYLQTQSENKIYKQQINQLNQIKKEIIKLDKNVREKSTFPINVIKSKNINAMILPNGSIFFTSGILDKKLPEQEMAFVLAHEIGHYSHKDHLKAISRQLLVILICMFSGQNNQVHNVVKRVTETEFLHYSRSQERAADLYAGDMLIKLYGTNEGGKSFINRLRKNEHNIDFLYYFQTHPSWNERLKLIEAQQTKS